MKVISGTARGMKLEYLKSKDIRPTKDRVKEALFDILQFQIQDKVFFDLFGGCGQIGIEAFSRGAKSVAIVEPERGNLKIIKKNVSKLKNAENVKIFCTDALSFLKTTRLTPDIAFLDPPYGEDALLLKVIQETIKIMPQNGLIITENLTSKSMPEKIENFSLQKKYKYGNITLNLYKFLKNSEI